MIYDIKAVPGKMMRTKKLTLTAQNEFDEMKLAIIEHALNPGAMTPRNRSFRTWLTKQLDIQRRRELKK